MRELREGVVGDQSTRGEEGIGDATCGLCGRDD